MTTLRRFAFGALTGVGDVALGEWDEWTGRAFHLRRRLSVIEQAAVGPAIDIRGTPEAIRRLLRVQRYVRMVPNGSGLFTSEMGGA
jgi:hypothetical protein